MTARGAPARPGPRAVSAAYWMLALVPLAALSVFYLYPLLRVLLISVTEPAAGLGNYREILASPVVRGVLGTTAWICAVTSAVSLALGYLLAYAILHVRGRWQTWMLVIVLLSFWVSILIRAFSWIALLSSRGLVNEALLALGLIDDPIAFIRNELGVMIGMVHYMIPYAVLPLMANMRTIDPRLVPAARSLGAAPLAAFARVYLPLSLPGLVSAGILVLIFSIGFYVTPALLGGGRVTMVAEYIALQVNETLAWGQGTALASSMLVVVFLLLLLLGRVFRFRQLFGAG